MSTLAGQVIETQFFNEGGVVVTNARFIVPNQTFAIAGITSVRFVAVPAKTTGAVLLGGCGVLVLLAALSLHTFGSLAIGLLMLGVGITMWRNAKADYSVALHTSGGEVKALTSQDGQYIRRVVAALNHAIVHRN
jgi:hypothetical protein